MVETVYLWLKSDVGDSVALGHPARIDTARPKTGLRKALAGAPWKTLRSLSLPRQFFLVGYTYSPAGQTEAIRERLYDYLKANVKGYE